MPEDPKRINFEGLKKEGTEIPDFGFDRKENKIETVKPGKEKNDDLQEGATMPIEKTGEAQPPVIKQVSTEIKDIENILEEDLGEIYFKLTPEEQNEFKSKGEQTARDISLLMQKTKIKAKKIIELIKNWLKIIPGINKFFLEQEAKIKADKILEFKKDD
jgi:hypothetical protein